jgi:hypothetical protein
LASSSTRLSSWAWPTTPSSFSSATTAGSWATWAVGLNSRRGHASMTGHVLHLMPISQILSSRVWKEDQF